MKRRVRGIAVAAALGALALVLLLFWRLPTDGTRVVPSSRTSHRPADAFVRAPRADSHFAAPAAPALPPVTISGRVTGDLGVAAGAVVSLTRETAESLSERPCTSFVFEEVPRRPFACRGTVRRELVLGAIADRTGDVVPVAQTTADADGAFRFDDVPLDQGAYALWVDHPDGVASLLGPSLTKGVPLEVKLEPISRLTVNVAAPPGAPRATVTVYLHDHSRFFETVAGEDAAARLSLSSGTYVLAVSAPGLIPVLQLIEVQGDAELNVSLTAGRELVGVVRRVSGPVPGCRVELNADGMKLHAVSDPSGHFRFERVPHDQVSLRAQCSQEVGTASVSSDTGSAELFVTGGRWVRGTLSTDDGEPLAEVPIYLDYGGRRSCAQVPPSAFTAEDGSFEAGPLQPGRLELHARAAGHAPVDRVFALDDRDVDLQLTTTALSALTGRVVDTSGAPIRGAAIDAITSNDSYTVFADAEGRFSLDHDGREAATFELRAAHFASYRAELPLPWTGEKTFVLHRGHTVTGRVLDEAGHPKSASVVFALKDATSGRTIDVETTEDGSFEALGVPAGDYNVVASSSTDEGEARIVARVPVAGPLELRLPATFTVSGRVLAGRDHPLMDAVVSAERIGAVTATADSDAEATGAEATTEVSDEDGTFSLKLLPGRYRLHAEVDESVSTTVEVSSTTSGLVLRFAELAQVSGRIVYPSGKSPHSFVVNDETVYDADGHFEVLVPRAQDELVVRSGQSERRLPLRWTGSPVELGDIVLPETRLRELVATVIDEETGHGVMGAAVTVLDATDNHAWSGTTDAEGAFWAKEVPEGRLGFIVDRFGYDRLRLTPGEVPATLTLRRLPRLRVTVPEATPQTTVRVRSGERHVSLPQLADGLYEGYVSRGETKVFATDGIRHWAEETVLLGEGAATADVTLRRTSLTELTFISDSPRPARYLLQRGTDVGGGALWDWKSLGPSETRTERLLPGPWVVIYDRFDGRGVGFHKLTLTEGVPVQKTLSSLSPAR